MSIPQKEASPESLTSSDDVVRSTNDDAIISKLSAVSAGYIDDECAKYFCRKETRRFPIINRGTYARFHGLCKLMDKFLDSGRLAAKQIVSLGAGSDTRYFLLKKEQRQPYKYFEVDFPEITGQKTDIIKKTNALASLLPDDARLVNRGVDLVSSDYVVLSGDLRFFDSHVVKKLEYYGLDRRKPTLFLAECVLVYMDPVTADNMIRWVAENFDCAIFITYEQILPNDAFGRVMLSNLAERGIKLPGIYANPTLQSHIDRYLRLGWNTANAIDMDEFFSKCIDEKELLRVQRLEIFDELEEWKLLAQHYCMTWAVKYTTDEQEEELRKVKI